MKITIAIDKEVVEVDTDVLDDYAGKCSLCKWFRGAYMRNKRENIGHWIDDAGWCVRFPPVFIGGEKDYDTDVDTERFDQPGVDGSDECGEYVIGYERVKP